MNKLNEIELEELEKVAGRTSSDDGINFKFVPGQTVSCMVDNYTFFTGIVTFSYVFKSNPGLNDELSPYYDVLDNNKIMHYGLKEENLTPLV